MVVGKETMGGIRPHPSHLARAPYLDRALPVLLHKGRVRLLHASLGGSVAVAIGEGKRVRASWNKSLDLEGERGVV